MLQYKQEIIKIKVVFINTDNGGFNYNYFTKITYYCSHLLSLIRTSAGSHGIAHTPSHLRIGPAPVLSVYHSCTIIVITTMLLEIYDTLKKFF